MRAIRRLLHWIWVGLDGLRKVLHLLLLLLIFAIIGMLVSRPIPLVPDKAALVVAPQGPLVEQFTGDPLERAVAEALRQAPAETLLRDVVDAIDAASDDDRISSLYLDLGGLDGGGTAKLQEVARAIDRFRASGKPVIAFGEYFDQPQYYLAAHADEIYLDPQGVAYVDGFANYGMFVKDALDKLSVDWNVFRVGQYKSAVEMFTRNDMSPAEREESLAWLNSVWGTWKADVAKARGIEPPVLQAYADNAAEALRKSHGDLAKMALEAGLVTGLKGRYEAEDRVAEITGEDEDLHSYKGVEVASYLANVRSGAALSSKPRRQGRRHRRHGRDHPGLGVAGHDRFRHAGRAAARCALRRGREGRGAAHRQPRRQHVRERSDPARGRRAQGRRQAGRRLDEHAWRHPAATTSRWTPTASSPARRRSPARSAFSRCSRRSSARWSESACTSTASARPRSRASSVRCAR